MYKQKDGQIFRFATCFGIDEKQLKEMMALHLTDVTINEFGRFDRLKDSADIEKVKVYFKKQFGEISVFKIRQKFDELLHAFIVSGGFDIEDK